MPHHGTARPVPSGNDVQHPLQKTCSPPRATHHAAGQSLVPPGNAHRIVGLERLQSESVSGTRSI
jgi:hypothetical protein